ncbi:hypothetical protein [Murimonas intestini]|uniref:Uncharacterized protein n=1 Tax=Murimonas intestini TaxID=1337051 RepID=A0AB73SZL5_9FIRM|nr:hypothetical protein [Murimonas intestini]MCR1842790.1 hypothetical protein [Murimonas intestini]MCR1867871.1 hypothetical protein [Murimonas intestini]MCR1885222.1 hypothetical protein [Murimonas intestini]
MKKREEKILLAKKIAVILSEQGVNVKEAKEIIEFAKGIIEYTSINPSGFNEFKDWTA